MSFMQIRPETVEKRRGWCRKMGFLPPCYVLNANRGNEPTSRKDSEAVDNEICGCEGLQHGRFVAEEMGKEELFRRTKQLLLFARQPRSFHQHVLYFGHLF